MSEVVDFPGKDKPEGQIFLETIFPEIPDGHAMLIWTLPDKRSEWFTSATAAWEYCESVREEKDLYVGVGLRRPDQLGPGRRGGSDDVSALAGLALDFDFAGPTHKEKNLPKDLDQLDQVLMQLPHMPAILVETGGGVHGWYPFHEIFVLEEPQDRILAMSISKGWSQLVSDAMIKHNWTLDSVWDLSRVLRIPGTYNHKGGQKRPVRIVRKSGSRWDPDEFELYAAEIVNSYNSGLGGLILNPKREPSITRVDLLKRIEPRFAQALERRGHRRGTQDNSPSSWDMTIANYCVQAGWTDQEIADVLIWSRRLNGDDLKLREDYYARTIATARKDYESSETLRNASTVSNAPGIPGDGAESNEERAIRVDPELQDQILQTLKLHTGLQVTRIICYGGERGYYSLVLQDGRTVSMGSMAEFSKWSTWWERAFELTRRAPEKEPKKAKWRAILAAIQPLIETYESEDAGEVAALRDQLRSYMSRARKMDGQDASQKFNVISKEKPFLEDGQLWFRIGDFQEFLRLQKSERMKRNQLLQILKTIGFESGVVSARSGEDNKSVRYWHGSIREVQPDA